MQGWTRSTRCPPRTGTPPMPTFSPPGTSICSRTARFSKRAGALATLLLPPRHAAGKHEIKMGVDIDRVSDYQQSNRHPYLVERDDGTLSRSVSFANAAAFIQIGRAH